MRSDVSATWCYYFCDCSRTPPALVFILWFLTMAHFYHNFLCYVNYVKVNSVEENLYSILFGSLGCYQLRIGDIYIYTFCFPHSVNSGCESTWGLAWGSKWPGQIFTFHAFSTLFEPRQDSYSLFLRSFWVTVIWRRCPWKSSFVWGSLRRPPPVGWPPLVPGMPSLCSHQTGRPWSLVASGHPGAPGSSNPVSRIVWSLRDCPFLPTQQGISKAIFGVIFYWACLVVMRRVVHFIYSLWLCFPSLVLLLWFSAPLCLHPRSGSEPH